MKIAAWHLDDDQAGCGLRTFHRRFWGISPGGFWRWRTFRGAYRKQTIYCVTALHGYALIAQTRSAAQNESLAAAIPR
jgi:hypothetical protein